jgi:hypothetical protein
VSNIQRFFNFFHENWGKNFRKQWIEKFWKFLTFNKTTFFHGEAFSLVLLIKREVREREREIIRMSQRESVCERKKERKRKRERESGRGREIERE